MVFKETLRKVGKYLGIAFYYLCMLIIAIGLIYGFFVYPVLALTESFGFGWVIVYLLVVAFVAYLGRNVGEPTRWG